jgi:hypothetical protein
MHPTLEMVKLVQDDRLRDAARRRVGRIATCRQACAGLLERALQRLLAAVRHAPADGILCQTCAS